MLFDGGSNKMVHIALKIYSEYNLEMGLRLDREARILIDGHMFC